MSETKYTVEFAKSARASCKKCKGKIEKLEIRIGSHATGGNFDVTSWYHPLCFNLPRKFSSSGVEDFVSTILEDATGGGILPERANELVEAIETKVKTPRKGQSADGHTTDSLIQNIKNAYEKRQREEQDDDDEDEAKVNKKRKKIKTEKDLNDNTDVDPQMTDLYEQYHKYKVDELKDILRYNRQILTGNKDVVLFRVIDGARYGRLARCPLCGTGKLKMPQADGVIVCNGTFDEYAQVRLDCAYSVRNQTEAPRWQPWYTTEPTDEESKEMDKLEKDAENPNNNADNNADVAKLCQAAEKLDDWNLKDTDGMKKAVADLLGIFEKSDKKLNLPDDARMKIGSILAQHREKSASDMIQLIIDQVGFAQDKADKQAAKTAALEHSVGHPANAGIVAAFQELAELYSKEGNRNAGAAYMRAVQALQGIPYEITEDNAKGLCKGATKVANIGKLSADKIYEYCSSGGKIEKLEEKRRDAA